MAFASTASADYISSTDTSPPGARVGYQLREALRAALRGAEIRGIEAVRLLPSETRYENAQDKVYFVLATHDIERDQRIVAIMIQFEGVHYDLVPQSAAGMIPDRAVKIL